MHPEYPNDNIRSLLRPGDSLVRRQFECIPSWDQSLFYQPCTPHGCYTKLPCSQCVKHIVRQWLFVNSVVVLWGWESLWVYGAAQQSRENKGLFLNPYGCLLGLLLSAEPAERVPQRRRLFRDLSRFLTAILKEQVKLAARQQRWSTCLAGAAPRDGRSAARQGCRTEGRTVVVLPRVRRQCLWCKCRRIR